MEAKKSPQANLENKRFIYTQVGIIIVLAMVLTAFEWKSYEASTINISDRNIDIIPEDFIELTKQEPKPPPEPPKPKQQLDKIKIIENTEEPQTKLDDFTIEATEDTKMDVFTPLELEDEVIEEEQIVSIVEDNPEYPGGMDALYSFLYSNIDYPVMAQESNVQGTVYLQFVIEKDGSISDPVVMRGIGAGCDEEALRVVKSMRKWKPGMNYKKPVRFRYTLPVKFILQN